MVHCFDKQKNGATLIIIKLLYFIGPFLINASSYFLNVDLNH